MKAAYFFAKLEARVFKPAAASLVPADTIPRLLSDAFAQVDQAINNLVEEAKFGVAA
jgi:hypothetical protein